MALTVIFHISLRWNTPLTLNFHSSIWYYYVHTTIKTTFPSIIPLHVPSSPVRMCLLWFFKKHSSVDSHPWKFPFIPRTLSSSDPVKIFDIPSFFSWLCTLWVPYPMPRCWQEIMALPNRWSVLKRNDWTL